MALAKGGAPPDVEFCDTIDQGWRNKDMSVEVGQKAPDLALSATTGDEISLTQYQGDKSVVLLFFPLAFTSVCTDELKIMRDEHDYYASKGAQVLAASVDSPFVLKAWAEQLELPFPLLSDFNKDVAMRFGALHEDLMGLKGVAKRAAFVIDRDGMVQYRWISDDPGQLPNFDEIKEAVAQAAS